MKKWLPVILFIILAAILPGAVMASSAPYFESIPDAVEKMGEKQRPIVIEFFSDW
jgi:hypothetical protein